MNRNFRKLLSLIECNRLENCKICNPVRIIDVETSNDTSEKEIRDRQRLALRLKVA